MKRALILMAAMCLATFAASAQEQKENPAPAKAVIAPSARLQAAKTAFVKKMEGSAIGADTVTTTLDGWGRYKLVDAAEKADLVIEVSSPEEGSGVSVSSSSSGTSRTGERAYEQSNKSSRELSTGGGPMRMVVRDAKTNTALWSATEQVKGAIKKNTRENNLVEAAQKLVSKFHERVEPTKQE